MREFLAIPLPENQRRAAVASSDVLAASGQGWRFVRDEGLHLTMRFLGEVDSSRHRVLDAAWREAAQGVGRLALRLRGAAVFPATGRPRVLWLGIEDETPNGSLARLADRMERAARPAIPPVERIGDLGAFVAERVVLYRSELDDGGSHYYEEAAYPLTTEGAS